MNLYSIDIQIVATAYIKAESPEEALTIAHSQLNTTMELNENRNGEIPIDGSDFKHLEPTVSLSPAISLNGPLEGQIPDLVD